MFLKKINPANPLRYFWILKSDLLREYYNQFINDPGYMPSTGLVYSHSWIEDAGKSIEEESTFEDDISIYLNYNTTKIISFIYARLMNIKKLESQLRYMDEIENELFELINDFKSNKNRGAETVLKFLSLIKSEVDNKIIPFLKIPGNEVIETNIAFIRDINKFPCDKSYKGLRSYKWKGNQFKKQLLSLYQLLKDNNIIGNDTDFNDFIDAFMGQPLTKRLNIKWCVLGKNKQGPSKPALFHFLIQLSKLDLINPINIGHEYDRIPMIFCDSAGKELTNLKQSRQEFERSIKPEKAIIIDTILNFVKNV